MRKYALILTFIILSLICVSCADSEEENKNFLGGYGEISAGAYSAGYISAFFEDDVYIYYDMYKINKESGQFVRLCETAGCSHNTASCIEYQYRNRIFPGKERIFYVNGKELYEIDTKGETTFIDVFETDKDGILLDESISIEKVLPLNSSCIFVLCSNGSCIYNLETKEKIYTNGFLCCGNENEIYYYDRDSEGIVKIDIYAWTSSHIENTKSIYPYICTDERLFCNTQAGAICYLNDEDKAEVCLAEEGMRYTLLGAKQNKIYYLLSDIDLRSGEYTMCDLYYSLSDGTERVKADTGELSPDMICFFNEDKIYLLKTDSFLNVEQVYVYSLDDDSFAIYENSMESTDDFSMQFDSEEDTELDNTQDNLYEKKSCSMSTNFYKETVDPLTGNTVDVMQKTEPFIIDGSRLKTTFYYNVDVEGSYPEEGIINIFVMCDGIIQNSSVNGGEEKLINQVTYKDGQDMYADIEFELANSSGNRKIIIGYYLSDYIITDDFDIFGLYNEKINYHDFTFELADNYTLEEVGTEEIYSEYSFDEIYTLEEGEQYNEIYELAAVSDKIPLGIQHDRWNIQIDEDGKLYIIFYSNQGQYNLYLLIDDEPVLINGENESILCEISGESDTVVYEIDANEIFHDKEKHSTKIMVYNRNTGEVKLYPDQIIQIKE